MVVNNTVAKQNIFEPNDNTVFETNKRSKRSNAWTDVIDLG